MAIKELLRKSGILFLLVLWLLGLWMASQASGTENKECPEQFRALCQ